LQDGLVGVATALSPAMAGHFKFLLHHFFVRLGLEPNQVVDFYKKEMPARGWKPSIGVLSQGGMLTYAKEGKSLIVMVGKSNGDTNMTITVGEAKR